MILAGQTKTNILKVSSGSVNLCNDELTCSYSIGLTTDTGIHWKFISEELHNLLVEELSEQEGKYYGR